MIITLNKNAIPEHYRATVEEMLVHQSYPSPTFEWGESPYPSCILKMTGGQSGFRSAGFTPFGAPDAPMVDATDIVMQAAENEIRTFIRNEEVKARSSS